MEQKTGKKKYFFATAVKPGLSLISFVRWSRTAD